MMKKAVSKRRRPILLIAQRVQMLCVAFLLFSLGEVKAQVGEFRSDLAIGFNAGVALNSLSFDPSIKQKMHVGPNAGLTIRYTCEKYFKTYCALQVELNYAQLGWKEEIFNSAGEPLPDTYVRHQHYVQLPLLARLAWGREKQGFMGYLVAGPQVGFCVGEDSERSDTWTVGADGLPDRPNNMSAQYDMPIENKFDYGITAGIGVELSTRAGHILLEGRYYYALSDIYGNSKKDVFGRSAHGTLMAKVSYLFGVGKKK